MLVFLDAILGPLLFPQRVHRQEKETILAVLSRKKIKTRAKPCVWGPVKRSPPWHPTGPAPPLASSRSPRSPQPGHGSWPSSALPPFLPGACAPRTRTANQEKGVAVSGMHFVQSSAALASYCTPANGGAGRSSGGGDGHLICRGSSGQSRGR